MSKLPHLRVVVGKDTGLLGGRVVVRKYVVELALRDAAAAVRNPDPEVVGALDDGDLDGWERDAVAVELGDRAARVLEQLEHDVVQVRRHAAQLGLAVVVPRRQVDDHLGRVAVLGLTKQPGRLGGVPGHRGDVTVLVDRADPPRWSDRAREEVQGGESRVPVIPRGLRSRAARGAQPGMGARPRRADPPRVRVGVLGVGVLVLDVRLEDGEVLLEQEADGDPRHEEPVEELVHTWRHESGITSDCKHQSAPDQSAPDQHVHFRSAYCTARGGGIAGKAWENDTEVAVPSSSRIAPVRRSARIPSAVVMTWRG